MVIDRKIDIDKNFLDYSRGQKMQVALMIALASRVPVLLLDEITSVIDVYGRKYFLELLSEYAKAGNTVVITTNIINELEFYTDNLIILKNKKIELNQRVSDIPKSFIKLRKKLDDENEIFNDENCIWAGVNSDRSISYIIQRDLTKKYDVPVELHDKRKSTLEDIFIYYFTQDL